MIKFKIILSSIAFLVFFCSEISAQSENTFAISFAQFNVIQSENQAMEMRLEYRRYNDNFFVNPFGGIMFNTQGALNIFGGFMKDFQLFGNIYFTPSFAPGIYMKGQSKDLSYLLEFRSQIEIAYRMVNGIRIGINFNHISNAGLKLPNVGVESFGISYIAPL